MLLDKIREFDIPVVGVIKPFESINNLLSYTRDLKGAEGFVVAFENGHRVKIKAEEYVRIHKTVDRITFDRNIVDLIVNEEVDDVIPMLPAVQVERIRDFETRFWEAFRQTENRLYGLRIAAQQSYEDDRKRIALEMVPTLPNKADVPLLFRVLDGYNIRDVLLDYVRKNIFTNVKWDACAEWMGM